MYSLAASGQFDCNVLCVFVRLILHIAHLGYVLHLLLICLLFSLLVLRSQTGEWAARKYFRNSLGYGVFLTASLYAVLRFVASSPYFCGDGKISPKFSPEM